MTTQELLAMMLPTAAGLVGGVAQSGQQDRNQQQDAQQQMNMKVQQMMAALQNAQQTGQNLQSNRQQMPVQQANGSPLGGEQSFVQRQRLMAAMLPEMAKFNVGGPTDPGVAAAYKAPTNMLAGLANPALQASYGDQATGASLAERRKLMAQINPDHQFESLGNFGIDPRFDQGVNQASIDSGARLKAYEAAQSSLANQQTQLASQNMNSLTNPPAEKPKGGGFKGFLGNVLKVAAPAAAFIPGVGPIASIGIGAAAGALGNKASGGSFLGGAAQGALGAGVGEVGQSLARGQGANPFNNGTGPKMNNAMTSASLPTTFMGNGMPQQPSNVNVQSQSLGGFTPFAQGVSQQPAGGQFTPPSRGGQTSQRPPQAPSFAGVQSGSSTSGPGPINNILSKATGISSSSPYELHGIDNPNLRRITEDMLTNHPLLQGYQHGGFGMGGGALQGVIGAGQRMLASGGPIPMGPASATPPPAPPAANWALPKQLGPGPAPRVGNPVSPSSGQTFNLGNGAPSQGQLAGAQGPRGLLGPGPRPSGSLPQGQYDMGPSAGIGPGTPRIPAFSQQTMQSVMKQLSDPRTPKAVKQQLMKQVMLQGGAK